jgi:hypothetical protein
VALPVRPALRSSRAQLAPPPPPCAGHA